MFASIRVGALTALTTSLVLSGSYCTGCGVCATGRNPIAGAHLKLLTDFRVAAKTAQTQSLVLTHGCLLAFGLVCYRQKPNRQYATAISSQTVVCA
jgi:hypothetical protein